MKKHTNKSSKLRDLTCIICGKPFQNYISLSEIAQGKGKICSRKCLGKFMSGIHSRGKYIPCEGCGEPIWVRPSRVRRNCHNCVVKKEGKSLSLDGYYVFAKVKIHRTMFENHYGIKLKPTDIIHHINGDKLDNRIENLQLVSRSQHNKIHFKIDDGLTNTQRFNLRHKRDIVF